MRIGQGFDAHRFSDSGRKLVLGGVEIAHYRGLAAHSDGDVVIHALCDALLGAAALGDIGRHYPPDDPRWKDIDSRVLLRSTVDMVRDKNFAIVNVDVTIVAEEPKLAPLIPDMVACLAADMGVTPQCVNVKATTTEGMGFTGRGEGIAVFAITLLDDDARISHNRS